MTNPLEELERWLEVAYDDGSLGATLNSFRAEDQAVSVEFETIDDLDSSAQWRLEADGCRESLWLDCEQYNYLRSLAWPKWSEDHVLLAAHQDDRARLSFAAPLAGPMHLFGIATKAHRALFGDRIPVSRFLRPTMFEERFGILAEGPERVIRAYEKVLRAEGADLGFSASPRRPSERRPTLVTIGDSYFVAESFRLIRLS